MWGVIIDKINLPNFILAIKILGLPLSYGYISYVLVEKDYLTVLVVCTVGQVFAKGATEILNAFVLDVIPDKHRMGEISFLNPIGLLVGAVYAPVASQFGWDYAALICVVSLGSLSIYIIVVRPFK